jgi:antitoxin ParD1/3/4
MQVQLTPEEAQLLERLMAEGPFASAREALVAGLKLLEQDLAWKADARKKIQEGLDDLKAGRVVDGEKAIEEILGRIGQRKGRKRA